MNISIVIPNYNGKELLEENISKVETAAKNYKAKTNQDVEIIIVDDKSSDNSVEYIEDKIKQSKTNDVKIILIARSTNNGFSTAVNEGVRQANGNVVILLNSDVVPEKDFIFPIVKHFSNHNVFAVGCMDKSIEGEKTVLRGRGIGKWSRGFLVHSAGTLDKKNTLWASGGSSAFKKSIWDKLGGMNELYNPFYWEDIDLSYRALKSGYSIVFERESVVIHKHRRGAIQKLYTPFQIKTITYRNQILFVWENITDLDLQLWHGLWLPYHLAASLVKGDVAFVKGFFRAFFLLPKIIQSSFRSQKKFAKTDKEILNEFSE